MVLEKTLESPLDCKEIYPVHPKGNQSWIFIGRIDAEAEAPIIWPPDAELIYLKDPDAGKDWRWEEKGMTEDEMVGWYHWLNEHEFEYTPAVSDVQGGLVCYSPWGHRESDMTEQLNLADWENLNSSFVFLLCVCYLCLTLFNLWTAACQAPLYIEFSRQEYWCGYLQRVFQTHGVNLGFLHWGQIFYYMNNLGSPSPLSLLSHKTHSEHFWSSNVCVDFSYTRSSAVPDGSPII